MTPQRVAAEIVPRWAFRAHCHRVL